MNNTLSDIKGINQFFDSIFKELKIDNQKQLNDAFIQKLSILVEKPIAEVQKDALNTQMLLMEKIQKTTQIFQDALNNNDTADNSIVEEEIYAWKQRLEALGINEGFESISEQVQNLLKATKEQNLKALGNSFEQLATYFEAENIGNNDTLVEELKKNLPLQYFEQISKHLKHNNSSIINQTLKQVAQKFK